MARVVSTKIAGEIASALGLKNVSRLVLTFEVHAVATAEATFFPEGEDLQKLPAITKRYQLIEEPTKEKDE